MKKNTEDFRSGYWKVTFTSVGDKTICLLQHHRNINVRMGAVTICNQKDKLDKNLGIRTSFKYLVNRLKVVNPLIKRGVYQIFNIKGDSFVPMTEVVDIKQLQKDFYLYALKKGVIKKSE